jgi:hypothetical protein
MSAKDKETANILLKEKSKADESGQFVSASTQLDVLGNRDIKSAADKDKQKLNSTEPPKPIVAPHLFTPVENVNLIKLNSQPLKLDTRRDINFVPNFYHSLYILNGNLKYAYENKVVKDPDFRASPIILTFIHSGCMMYKYFKLLQSQARSSPDIDYACDFLRKLGIEEIPLLSNISEFITEFGNFEAEPINVFFKAKLATLQLTKVDKLTGFYSVETMNIFPNFQMLLHLLATVGTEITTNNVRSRVTVYSSLRDALPQGFPIFSLPGIKTTFEPIKTHPDKEYFHDVLTSIQDTSGPYAELRAYLCLDGDLWKKVIGFYTTHIGQYSTKTPSYSPTGTSLMTLVSTEIRERAHSSVTTGIDTLVQQKQQAQDILGNILEGIDDPDVTVAVKSKLKAMTDDLQTKIDNQISAMTVDLPISSSTYVLKSKIDMNNGPVRLAAAYMPIAKRAPLTFKFNSVDITTTDLNDDAIYTDCVIEFEKFNFENQLADKMRGV